MKKLILSILAAGICGVMALNITLNNTNDLSGLSLTNLEALAGEIGNGETAVPNFNKYYIYRLDCYKTIQKLGSPNGRQVSCISGGIEPCSSKKCPSGYIPVV